MSSLEVVSTNAALVGSCGRGTAEERPAGAVGQPRVSPRLEWQVPYARTPNSANALCFQAAECGIQHFLPFLLGIQSLCKNVSSLKLIEFNSCPCC